MFCVCVCVCLPYHFERRPQRLGESGCLRLLRFSPAFAVLVTTSRKTDAERKLLRRLCWPQNDWVLGLFQLLHCWAATAGEYENNMDVRSLHPHFCTAAVFDVNAVAKCIFRLLVTLQVSPSVLLPDKSMNPVRTSPNWVILEWLHYSTHILSYQEYRKQ